MIYYLAQHLEKWRIDVNWFKYVREGIALEWKDPYTCSFLNVIKISESSYITISYAPWVQCRIWPHDITGYNHTSQKCRIDHCHLFYTRTGQYGAHFTDYRTETQWTGNFGALRAAEIRGYFRSDQWQQKVFEIAFDSFLTATGVNRSIRVCHDYQYAPRMVYMWSSAFRIPFYPWYFANTNRKRHCWSTRGGYLFPKDLFPCVLTSCKFCVVDLSHAELCWPFSHV